MRELQVVTWGPCPNRPSGSDKGKCNRQPPHDWRMPAGAAFNFPSVLHYPDSHRACLRCTSLDCGAILLACELWHLGMPVDGAVPLRKHQTNSTRSRRDLKSCHSPFGRTS
ncbi:uncharacterized protein M421DRAFT_344419 [Didymella exigua CBS 183.55]|uniref:Uncharacterized protein n=1 Tax=Didymella exigua CBS 183.55 TaxID=1150837 RepID=A0A6A5RSE5_9PLEO|nr:uncharacterized protein M421DRAFT_344419 [Didymella exigua CBS 183.55]KAF1931315.1 hypothetical protein M421DRAFT_344419 [Didymella exigua CBS 183.55]